ncbi:hypothetical protein SAMN05660653_02331 [Desulfonatronum thiosulfatophilum]|uniref:Uncharacterized protein n=1 Tax=Desulfonatronum thiosulfatophilum TaxID=617002 RepID=A0A1G6DQV5_9BACT|nr:hypothetical protein [Desulfonatronum thiosulfatophilum]SDB47554.1 hypothetical protein SAMN05660653_02331 [Desulfonatronum thiosulfatophilum]
MPEMMDNYTMRLAFRSLEDVYVRGRTVHFVGNDHRFYGNIECESAADLQVSDVTPEPQGLLGAGDEWGFWIELTLDEEMARSGNERIHFHFKDKDQAMTAHEAFQGVAESIRQI